MARKDAAKSLQPLLRLFFAVWLLLLQLQLQKQRNKWSSDPGEPFTSLSPAFEIEGDSSPKGIHSTGGL